MKKFFETLSRMIGFTPNEGKIVFILVGTFLLGGALKLAGVSTSKERSVNYAGSDSIFYEKSRQGYIAAESDDTLPGTALMEQNENAQALEVKDTTSDQHPININTATKEEFMKLPGIGEAMAERIILYREDKGIFTSLSQLLNVKGIGEKKLEQLKPFIILATKQ